MDISCSGTLGDTYIVFCKLAGHHQRTGKTYTLTRYSYHEQFDKPLKSFFSTIPFIEYRPYKHLLITEAIKQTPMTYIGVSADGKAFSKGLPDDPPGFEMEPYPKINIRKKAFRGRHVGIQLHSGKDRHNFKGFTLTWITELIRSLPKNITWHLLGTGEGYDHQAIEEFCLHQQVINHVGKTTFEEWLQLMKSMNYFITPEGFSAFYALSQHVPTYSYYTLEIDLKRVHPAWRSHAHFEAVKTHIQLKPLLRGKIQTRITPTLAVAKVLRSHR